MTTEQRKPDFIISDRKMELLWLPPEYTDHSPAYILEPHPRRSLVEYISHNPVFVTCPVCLNHIQRDQQKAQQEKNRWWQRWMK